jgi:hypothetical protein
MQGKSNEVLRAVENSLPKETSRLALLGSTGRLHKYLIVWRDTASNLQFLLQRHGYSWFISENKMFTKPSS